MAPASTRHSSVAVVVPDTSHSIKERLLMLEKNSIYVRSLEDTFNLLYTSEK